ncbi:hypothetical protein AHAS_Ahas05G0153200 [Arachis hypogaea]
MEFTSSFDKSYHMGYCPPPQNDSSHYPNGGWEYHQEMINYEQSTQLGYAPGPQNDQSNFLENFPPAQNDSRYYAYGGWEYQEHEMGYFPEPQIGPYFDHYSTCGRGREFNAAYPIHQEPSPSNCPTYALE